MKSLSCDYETHISLPIYSKSVFIVCLKQYRSLVKINKLEIQNGKRNRNLITYEPLENNEKMPNEWFLSCRDSKSLQNAVTIICLSVQTNNFKMPMKFYIQFICKLDDHSELQCASKLNLSRRLPMKLEPVSRLQCPNQRCHE